MAIIAKPSEPKTHVVIEVNILYSMAGTAKFRYTRYVTSLEEIETELANAYKNIKERYANA